jgi:hypothetical protein
LSDLSLQERGRLERARSEALLGRLLRRSFDPSEPRDESGRWTDGGGSGGRDLTEQELKSDRLLGKFQRDPDAPEGTERTNVPFSPYSHTGVERQWQTNYEKFKDEEVPVENIRATQDWVNPEYEPDVSIGSEAIHGVKTPDGLVHISDGHHRVWWAKNHGVKTVEAKVATTRDLFGKVEAKRGFDPSEPRDESGKWTDEGGGAAAEDEKLLLVSEQPSQEKLDAWHKQIEEAKATAVPGDDDEEQHRRMESAIDRYLSASPESIANDNAGLNTVYDGDKKLLAATFTEVDTSDIAKVVSHGAIDHDAKVKALKQVIKRYGDKVKRIEIRDWADEIASITAMRDAGFRQMGDEEGGRLTFGYGEGIPKPPRPPEEVAAEEKHAAMILGAARATAKLSGYDPNLVDVNNGVYKFSVGGKSGYRAAGLAHLDTGKIEIFPKQIYTPDGAVSVTVHEIAHQEYQKVLNALAAETNRVMADPETSAMRPDGSLPPPLDKKYPIYSRFVPHVNSLHKRIDDDGVSDYSKDYWKEVKPGGVTINSAEHETIAEMARIATDTGKLPGSKIWRDYYKDIEKTYKEFEKKA